MQKLLDLSLADCLMANTSLRILNLGHNNFGDNAIRAIGPALRLSRLSELSLVECEIRMSGARALGEGLKLNNCLVRLDLRQNPFGDVGISALASSLEANTTLTSLELDRCRIQSAGIEKLSKALASNKSIRSLSMGMNSIGDAGACAIAVILASKHMHQSDGFEHKWM